MVSSLASFRVFLLILSLSSSFSPVLYCMGGFSIDLFHPDSKKSHLLASNFTPSSRIKVAAERSFARAISFRDSIQNKNSSSESSSFVNDNIFSDISSTGYGYYMRIKLGSKPTSFEAIVDTGSDLFWVECIKNISLFDPRASSTYNDISCHAGSCSIDLRKGCGPKNQCEFKYTYMMNLAVEGYLGTDTLTFDSNGKHPVQIKSIKFGCAHHIDDPIKKHSIAIVGLGGSAHSLIHQIRHLIDNRFSYCLNPYNHRFSTSRLNFGSNAIVSDSNSVTTPLFLNSLKPFYYVNLQRISVEGQGDVNVKPAKLGTKGNIIIDSGTMQTFIDMETFQSLETEVLKSVQHPKVPDPNGNFNLCFKVFGVILPSLTFHFSDGAVVLLKGNNIYIRPDTDTVCLAVVSHHEIEINIFGNLAQQNFHIGYDLSAMKLTIAPADCAKK